VWVMKREHVQEERHHDNESYELGTVCIRRH
jgi:hypothetical protein